MLETIRAVASIVKSVAAVASAIWTAVQVIAVGMGVKGYMEAKDLMNRGQAILGQKTAQGGKIPVIYGRRRVGSTLALLHTHDGRSQNLVAIYALSVGEVDQIELDTIEINGVPIKDTKVFTQGYYAGSDKISSGAGSLCTASQIGVVQESNAGQSGTNPARRYRMVFNAHHGASDQTVDPMLLASTPEVITSNHRLRGIAYIAASFEYDTEGMFRSIPQLTVVVRGKKLYDPRKDGSITGGSGSHRFATPSTYEWSDNAALCLLDYLRDDEYGKGLASTAINLQSFQTAANTSDELEDTPDYSGSASAATFSGTSGNSFINVDETTWKNSKIGGLLTLEDSGSATEFDQVSIIDALRYHEFEATNPIHQLVINDTLSSSYTNEVGTALVKVKRFHCNGLIDTNKNVLENTQELLANMRGILNYIDGKYEVTLEDTASSSFTVTDDHIIADNGITVNYEDKSKKANKVVVQFFNALKSYEMDTVTVFHDPNNDDDFSDYKSDDGGEELELVVDFPYIVNKYVAYNMGEAILGRSRNQQTISFTGTPELYKVKVGDVITVSYTPLGYTGKLFRVEAMNLQPNGLIDIQAVEYLDIYTWTAPPQENIEAIARIPTGREVKAPSGLSFTDTDSSSTGRPFISWNAITDFPQYEFRVSIVDSSGNKVLSRVVSDNFVDLNFLPIGSNYVATVTTINGQQAESSGTTLTFSISNTPTKAADVDVAGVITAGSIAVTGDIPSNVSDLTNDAGYTTFDSGDITQSLIEAKITDAASFRTDIAAYASSNPSGFTNFAATDVQNAIANNVTTISGNKLTTGTINAANCNVINLNASNISSGTISSDRINTNTLNVKFFDNVTSQIINHNSSAVPLTRFGNTYTTTSNSGGSGVSTHVPTTITNCRSGGSFVAFLTGILGDVQNAEVEFSVDGGSSFSTCANGVQFSINAGTFRPYTLIYSDTLSFSGSNQTAIFRVRFNGKANYTQLGLTVLVDNTN
tara:strand:- start:251 stop:3214 length:2964 start_codon:yes stop_codon:yes gene_type:complete